MTGRTRILGPGSSVRAALSALALIGGLVACGPPRPVAHQGPPPEYPGALVASTALRSPAALGDAFALEQRVVSSSPAGDHEFRAVLQLHEGRLVLVGFGPHGGRGFALTLDGDEVEFDSQLPEELPFPPEFMLHDVQRVWFMGLDGPLPDGDHTERRDGEEITERWADGRLMERRFRRLDDRPTGELVVRYGEGEPRGLGGDAPPGEVVLENGWFGYTLTLRTLSHQRLAEEGRGANGRPANQGPPNGEPNPAANPATNPEEAGVPESDPDSTASQARVFLFGERLDLPEGCDGGEARRMRVRGYRLGFVSGVEGGSVVTLQPIRGDGTVPGLSYLVSGACLGRLDEAFAGAGLERRELHVESNTAGRSASSVPATAWLAPGDRPPAAATEAQVSAVRAAWVAAGLDTGAIDYAVQRDGRAVEP